MAENINPLILPIGADPSQFKKSINDVKAAYKELSNTISSTPFNLVTGEQKTLLSQYGETIKTLTNDVKQFGAALGPPANSIAGLDKKISELNKKKINLDANTSALEIARLSQEIDKLTAKRNNIDALGASVQKIGQAGGSSFKKLEDSSKGGRIALTSLSLVAQDLPFGLIAIQNNLPAVYASFGQLSKGSAGLKGAFSQIGSALVGPAGLFLAFSIVTGAVTFAVQKYGSLSNAVTALVSDNEELAVTIAKASKEYDSYNSTLNAIELSLKKSESSEAGKIQTIKILTETVSNLQNSEFKRSNALNQLKSIDKDYYGSFTTSAEDSEKLRKATDLLTESIIKQARIKGLESRITEITLALDDIQEAQSKIAPAFSETAKKVEASLNKASQFGQFTIQDVGNVVNLSNIVNKLQQGDAAIDKETERLKKSKETLKAELDGIINLGKTDTSKSESFKFEIEPLVDILSLEQKISLLERLGTIILDTKSKESERIQALKELSDLEYDVFGGIKLQNLTYNQLKSTLTGLGKTYQSLILQERQRVESLRLVDEAIQRQTYLNKVDRDEFVRNYKEKRQEINKTAVSIPKQITVPVNFFINTENLKKLAQSAEVGIAFGKEQKDIKDREEKYLASVKKIGNAVETGLQKPFRDFFDTLIDEGKFTFDSFADFAKDAFKRILAQLAAAGIARLVTTILTGGIPVPIGSSRIQQPRFDGVGTSPLQIAGAVNLTLRGSDLVGSINRTNSTINRVG